MFSSHDSYHLVVAQNFLRNISLDGTHVDTQLRLVQPPDYAFDEQTLADGMALLPEMCHRESVEIDDYSDRSSEFAGRRKAVGRSRRFSFRDRLSSSGSGAGDNATDVLLRLSESAAVATAATDSRSRRFSFNRSVSDSADTGDDLRTIEFLTAGSMSHSHFACRENAESKRSLETMETTGLRPFCLEGKEVSYSSLLKPSRCRSCKAAFDFSATNIPSACSEFPNLLDSCFADSVHYPGFPSRILDDSEFRPRIHRTTLTFTSYMTSIIDYTNAEELKKEMNEKFLKKYPEIQLTYSKYQSLKKDMKKIAVKANIDLVLLAEAYAYFDEIILKAFIDKLNRKCIAGVCMLLASKMNDVKGPNLSLLIEAIKDTFRLEKHDLFQYELPVVVALEFGLHLRTCVVAAHYQKIAWYS